MKKMILLTLLLMALFDRKLLLAQFENPGVAFGFSAGGAQGHNNIKDEWVMQYRGHFQYKIFSHYLLGQLGAQYTELRAPSVYEAETILADNRFLFIPFSLDDLNPYLYGGFGVSKSVKQSGSDYLSMVPFGLGLQTRLGSQIILDFSGGYNLSLSDELDGLPRDDNDLNELTNRKQDGFFGFLVGFMFSASGGYADQDHDGLSNHIEKELRTDPKNPDSDRDGLQDGAEVYQQRTDPLKADSEFDGLNDGDEVNRYRSDPMRPDSDADGLSDGEEANTPRNGDTARTDPTKADTDSDGLNDGAEVNQFHSDATKPDTDGDTLVDGEEVNKYKSDPRKQDSDEDGLFDGNEVNNHKTDPVKPDTDADGLSDAVEVNKHKSDPLKVDTDGGGANDGTEATRGTNLLDPKDDQQRFVLEKGKKVVLRGVNFEFGKATLTRDSEAILEDAYDALMANPDLRVEISGHTDNIGSEAFNYNLSLRRAQAVKNWLIRRGVAFDRMRTVGRAESEPVADNSTDYGRAENRRIEFYVEQ